MNLVDIKAMLSDQGHDLNDFDIEINEGGYSVSPKWYYENKKIAKQQDKPIIEDVNVTAETIVYTAQDVMMLADTVMQLMGRVIELEAKVNG